MIATFSFNIAILAIMILIPLLYPEILPKSVMAATLIAPPLPPRAAPQPRVREAKPSRATATTDPFHVPKIPTLIASIKDAPPVVTGGDIQMGPSSPNGPIGNFISKLTTDTPQIAVLRVERKAPPKISAGVMAGQIITKTAPIYPAIARASRISGIVTLHAIISKAGTIEDLTVLSGNEMLRAAAVEAVKSWRYRPYLLSGEPTEVETTITVNFNIS
jgi:protein TonB